ncbi:MAG: DUF4351 domain-containing protein [Magnetococcales bacterium]|nr:DUF4351 domain-containing protein [Magnetococcales bacterium]
MAISENGQVDTNHKTQWHCLLGKVLEESLTTVNVAVQTEVDVVSGSPKADIILLRREGAEWTDAQKVWLADGLRDTTAREELLEFKFTESLTEEAIAQLFVYDHLYRAKQKLDRSALQSFLLLAKTPHSDILPRFGFTQTAKAGVYASSLPLFGALRVILLNELTDKPHNVFLKCFASKNEAWHEAFAVMDRQELSHISKTLAWILFGIRRIRMKGAMDNVKPIGLTPEYVMDLGRRAWFEEMMNTLPDEELFKVQRAVDIWQDGKQKGELKGEQKSEVKILLRQLTRRFGALSPAIREKVETAASDTLEQWSDLILDARSLEEVFGPSLPDLH